MVKAGETVDDMIAQLLPHLEPGDIIIDGGNSHYPDTQPPHAKTWREREFCSSAPASRAVKKGARIRPVHHARRQSAGMAAGERHLPGDRGEG